MKTLYTHDSGSLQNQLAAAFKTTTIVIALTALATTTAHETADQNSEHKPKVTIKTTTSSEEETDWGYSRRDGGSSGIGMSGTRLPGKTKVLKTTTEISQVIDIEQSTSELLCESDIDLEYYQKDEVTEVRTLFSSENCAEFDATYQLRIMYFDAEGSVQRIIADEAWPVGQTEQVRKSYPMHPDSELRRVTSRILSCTCRSNQ